MRLMGLNFGKDGLVKGFFGGNAYLAIIFLLFICIFLWKSAIGFVPHYREDLSDARISGIEVSNLLNEELKGHQALYNLLNAGFINEKRQLFGSQEAVIYLYEELEAVIDEELEDPVDTFLELEDGPEKKRAAEDLKELIDKTCRAIPESTLLVPIQKRINDMQSIPDEVLNQAIVFAQAYALDDYTTPQEIEAIHLTINKQMGNYGEAITAFKKSVVPLSELRGAVEAQALSTFEAIKANREAERSVVTLTKGLEKLKKSNGSAEEIGKREKQIKLARSSIKTIDTDTKIQPVYQLLEQHDQCVQSLISGMKQSLAELPSDSVTTDSAKESIQKVDKLLPEFEEILSKNKSLANDWRHDIPFTTWDSLKAFFFGTDWNTGSSRQSLFGIIPLFTGSLLISLVAMCFAVPLSIGAAIYVNQFASKKEAGFLKPMIEFIQAIPSVVLGLFGVLVVAGLLKDLSQVEYLSWIPGFPIADRLNVLLAGILLAFMASPTIFTLAEDALNNVPKAHTEASLAMGANRLQTAIKVIVPASLSGIIAAIMLGFGRVIGETMVVLLVAGNMANMPDFSAGFDVIGQSVHTMTGIIASENGEAVPGTILWEGLFMVGLVLFMISLTINSICQRILNRNKH